MKIVLFDNESWENLLPLTFTRPIGELRIGILTIKEKWQSIAGVAVTQATQSHLVKKYPLETKNDHSIFIAANVIPTVMIWDQVRQLNIGEALYQENDLVAFCPDAHPKVDEIPNLEFKKKELLEKVEFIHYPWDIFLKTGEQVRSDINLLGLVSKVGDLHESNTVIGDAIYIEEGAKVFGAILNATSGPIYIGKNAEIMEGSVVRGPFALGEHSTLKMATKAYGDSSIGPHCKVGGEISNVSFQGYSNKGHDGFLGNSVIGEWCNLGADTNSSNLKNNYGKVQVWNYAGEAMADSDQQFCGLIMGDHSKTGINTMLNTGTVAGVCANIFDSGFPPKFVPSFSWGGANGFETFRLEKGYEVAQRMMERRGIELTGEDKDILKYCFNHDAKFRS